MAERVEYPHPITIEYVQSQMYKAVRPPSEDPFRHLACANSHNHHDRHPWGRDVLVKSDEFVKLYSEANNQYMYHLWYTPELAPHMATEIIKIEPMSAATATTMAKVLRILFESQSGVESALKSTEGSEIISFIQGTLDAAGLKPDDSIFIRLGATSLKDSFAINVPTTKPTPLRSNGELVLRRLLTSGRSVGRLLALSENLWPGDPGEALIIQRWSAEIDLSREIRVFCHEGRVTAISQDIWWEKMGWRDRYSDGFVEAIVAVWEAAKPHLNFSTCTMDVLMTLPSHNKAGWEAKIIEFNGFGAHLNTGSDLFHWVNDEDILHGRNPGIVVRFVDDWEGREEPVTGDDAHMVTDGSEEGLEDEPDWLALENKLKEQYKELDNDSTNLPLKGRWASAY